MAQLVPLTFDDGLTVYVEASESAVVPGQSAIQEAAAKDAASKAVDAAKELSESIQAFCGRVITGFQSLAEGGRPNKATVQFGVNVSVEGNVYVVKGGGEASITVSAEWDFGNAAGA